MELLLALALNTQKPNIPQPPVNRGDGRRIALVITVTRADCAAQGGKPINDKRNPKKDRDIVRCDIPNN